MEGFGEALWAEDEARGDEDAEGEEEEEVDDEDYLPDCVEAGEAEGGLGQDNGEGASGHGACEPVPVGRKGK